MLSHGWGLCHEHFLLHLQKKDMECFHKLLAKTEFVHSLRQGSTHETSMLHLLSKNISCAISLVQGPSASREEDRTPFTRMISSA